MGTLSIKVIPPDTLGRYRIERNHTFVRRDLYRFMDFILHNDLKRGHRGNTIPKGPAQKLARILSYKKEMAYVEANGCGYWSDRISHLARCMKLVRFATEGKYIGYSCREPSYPENYIESLPDPWNRYMALSSLEKEWAIWEGLNKATGNEFHRHPTLLDDQPRFDTFGSGVNAASKMDLPNVRVRLLDILSRLTAGVWYSLHDLVAYLKDTHPDLIIDHRKRDNCTKNNIYDSFYECPFEGKKEVWGERIEIHEGAPDAYERVEGRYVAFFLEDIPFLMGFVELAFHGRMSPPVSPPYGDLAAFSLTPRFFSVYGRDPSYNHVKVTVQPNHEVVVQYSGYAEKEMEWLKKYGMLINDDQTLIFRLEKKRVADSVASGEDIGGIIQRLKALSSTPIPQNILAEMEHWGSHGDKITLYRGYSLLEIDPSGSKKLPDLKAPLSWQIEKEVTPSLFLIKDGQHAFEYLEEHGYLPQELNHEKDPFRYDHKTHSRLKAAPVKKEEKEECEVSFKEFSVMECEKREILLQVEKGLAKKGIPSLHLSEKGMLLVPLSYMKTLEAIARKSVEKSGMRIRITE